MEYILQFEKFNMLVKEENNFITFLQFSEKSEEENIPTQLGKKLKKELEEYFSRKRKYFSVPIKLSGTPFQIKVWEELKKIPYGELKSYKDIGEKVGAPKGYRAVGTANGKNPICIIVPCHRVVNANGKIGGYSGGLDKKIILLDIEKK